MPLSPRMNRARKRPEILLVYGGGGPPIDYLLPALARRGTVNVLLMSELNPYRSGVIKRYAKRVKRWPYEESPGIVDAIASCAREVSADVLVTVDEFLVVCVAEAAQLLGLRGAGPNARSARSKLEMRSRWQRAGLPSPRFHEVNSLADLLTAANQLDGRFVLKDVFGAGGVGTHLISPGDDLSIVYADTLHAIREGEKHGMHEWSNARGTSITLIAEDLMVGDANAWFSDAGRGDFVSVEGVVTDGEPRSLAVTGRMLQLPPFCETGDLTPSGLSADDDAVLMHLAERAVRAIGLQNCVTHTEFKLMRNREIGLLEVAARIGGTTIARQVHEVYGICLVDQLLSSLLGEPAVRSHTQRPPASFGAAGSLEVLGANAQGVPWSQPHRFQFDLIDWATLTGPGVTVELEHGQSLESGSTIHPYVLGRGILNAGAVLYVKAADASSLLKACHDILNNLESALLQAAATD